MHQSRFLLAAVVAVAAPVLASVNLPPENERWTRLELDDYVIYSAARDNITRDVAQRLQLMRDGLAMITRLNVHPPQRVTVILFPNDRTFAPFRDAGMGKKMEHVSALFGGTSDAGFMLINTDANAGLDRSVYHELTHCFTRNTAQSLPLWFSEGIAEFYSTFQTYGRDKLRIGMPVVEHLDWLRSRGMIPLARLFAVDFNSPDYSEAYRAGDFYAESWLLVHYLMLGNPERNKRLGAFLTLLSNDEPPSSAVEKAFGIKIAQLEGELRRYLNQPTMNVGTFTPAEKHTYVVSDPAPASRDAILLVLGKFLARSLSSPEAKPFYDAALRANPNNGDVYAAIADLAERNGNSAERDAAIARAVDLGTTDAHAYVAFGHSLIDHVERPSTADVERARAMFTKAIGLNPRSAFAYAGLGATYFESGDDEKAIAAYNSSLAIEARDDIAYNLVMLYARGGRRDLAQRTIDRYITPRGNADLAAAAREILTRVDAQEAARKQVEEINRAIDLANKGHLTDALAVIDSLLPSIADAQLQAQTKSLRAQLASAAKKK